MSANEYLSTREWIAEVTRLVESRLKMPLAKVAVASADMVEAWEDGVTPEEFYEADIVPVVFPTQIGGDK